jgi:predicted ATPase
LVDLAAGQGFAHWHATATFLHGWALATAGVVAAGLDEMRRGLAAKQATGAQIKVPYYLGLLAGALGAAGSGAEALVLLEEAMARVERTGERWYEAELYRLRGEVSLQAMVSDANQVEACFRKALEVARKQDAKWWELRAAGSLARLWRDQGKRAEARDLLAPVYGWFTEGFDTQDLKQARALLGELG